MIDGNSYYADGNTSGANASGDYNYGAVAGATVAVGGTAGGIVYGTTCSV